MYGTPYLLYTTWYMYIQLIIYWSTKFDIYMNESPITLTRGYSMGGGGGGTEPDVWWGVPWRGGGGGVLSQMYGGEFHGGGGGTEPDVWWGVPWQINLTIQLNGYLCMKRHPNRKINCQKIHPKTNAMAFKVPIEWDYHEKQPNRVDFSDENREQKRGTP